MKGIVQRWDFEDGVKLLYRTRDADEGGVWGWSADRQAAFRFEYFDSKGAGTNESCAMLHARLLRTAGELMCYAHRVTSELAMPVIRTRGLAPEDVYAREEKRGLA